MGGGQTLANPNQSQYKHALNIFVNTEARKTILRYSFEFKLKHEVLSVQKEGLSYHTYK